MRGAEVSQSELEAQVLRALFDYAQSATSKLAASETAALFNGEFSDSRVKMALKTLERLGDVDATHSSYSGSHYEISESGYKKVERDMREGALERVPASDRIVNFNHNQPDALEIQQGLADVKEAVRGSNLEDVDDSERTRVIASLEAAENLWRAAAFRVIQLKIGVLMAVEDAARLLKNTAKSVAASMLVEAIKAFTRNHFNIDLDAL